MDHQNALGKSCVRQDQADEEDNFVNRNDSPELGFEFIQDYHPNTQKENTSTLKEMIKLLQETKARLERENNELKENLTRKTQALKESRETQISLQEKVIQLTSENAALQRQIDTHVSLQEKVIQLTSENAALQERVIQLTLENAALQERVIQLTLENAALQRQVDTHITEEKLRSLLNENSLDLSDKLDEKFKQHLAVVRERNLNIREHNPFPFTADRTMGTMGGIPWLLSHHLNINKDKKKEKEKEKDTETEIEIEKDSSVD